MDENTDNLQEIESWFTDNPDSQSNQVQTSEAPLQLTDPATLQLNEASPQTETKGKSKKKRQSTPSAAQRDQRRRASDTIYREKLEGKWEELRRNVPGCSKDLSKEKNIDKIIDCIQTLRQRVEETEDENKNLKEQLKHQSVSPQEETVLANAASLMPEDPQVIVETSGVKSVSGLESQWNATEVSRDASSQGQEPTHNNVREIESVEEEQVLVNALSLTVEGLQETIEISGLKSVSGVESQLNAPEASRDASLQLQEATHYLERETESVLKKRKQREEDETVPVNAASSMPEGPQDIAEIRGLNATEATRDASLQVQEPTPNNVKEIEAVLPSNEEAKHGTCGYGNESDEAAFGSGSNEHEPSDLNGIRDDPSPIVLSSKRRKQIIEEAEVERTTTIHSPAERFPSMQLSVSHPTSNDDATAADTNILTKLNADDESTVQLSDFPYLGMDRIKVGKYIVPLSLHQTTTNINYLYNDVYAKCKMNPRTIQPINIVFIASIKEMNDLTFGLILNEKRILKLRDAINDALRIDFKVDPAMEYLKKIARAHIALKELENEPLRRLKGKDVSFAAVDTDILTKLDTDDESTVELSDFSCLDGEHTNIGKYSVPSSLESTAKKISGVCGDFSATCKMNPHTVNPIYIMLCAAVKEMNDQPIKQVTEERILKSRDAIMDALRVGFKVDFAKVYLEKIAHVHIALNEVENDPLRRSAPVSCLSSTSNVNGDDDGNGCRSSARKKRLVTA